MSDLQEKLNKIISDIEKNLKNKEDVEYVKTQIYNIYTIFLDEFDEIESKYNEKMDKIAFKCKVLDDRMNEIESSIEKIESDIYVKVNEEYDFGNYVVNYNTSTGNTVGSIPGSGTTMPPTDLSAPIAKDTIDTVVTALVQQEAITAVADKIAPGMTEAVMQKSILTKVGELTGKLMEKMGKAFNVDTDKFASAFKFEMTEDEMRRLFETMSTATVENSVTNLIELGYQDVNEPTTISFYFQDFDSKEKFIDFLKDYNDRMEKEDEDKVINYTDITGILMSSVKTIVDSVSYVLIAFVSISLVVSSIMIGIITYISVLERTKEIGILRAIGASKRNISSIFNAETFIVGLFAGVMGIVVTILLLIPTNLIIHSVNEDITAVLPTTAAIVLVILSVILTLIGGIIPSKQAAKKDPVLALRSE